MKHVFPSGLIITKKTESSQYGDELNQCKTQEDLNELMQRWKFLLPELDGITPNIYEVKPAIHSFEMQEDLIERAKNNDSQAMEALNAIIPPSLLKYDTISHELNKSLGYVLFELKNNQDIIEENGFWFLS